MIKVKNLKKKYGNTEILHEICLDFPDNGIVSIVGDSGCGKTTLLNCISGLDTFEGSVIYQNTDIGKLSANDRDDLRIKSFGFVFQDFKLFENQSCFNNVAFPLSSASNFDNLKTKNKVNDLLLNVGQIQNAKKTVSKLSGGEKQRVAIARALVNDPRVIFADEPTGALDYENAKKIMDTFSAISKNTLVIIVSHDFELMKEYADKIVEMRDGRITAITNQEITKEITSYPVIKNSKSNKRISIPIGFLFRHSLDSLKNKKWRTAITTSVTSISLIGIGLAFTISSSISSSIKESYSSIADTNRIIVTNTNLSNSTEKLSCSYIEASSLAEKFDKYIIDVGTYYSNNFEEFFLDVDEACVSINNKKVQLKEISSRSINEFKWMDVSKPEIYPSKIDSLKNDEVVLGLDITAVYKLCVALNIERSVKSLSDYLNDTSIYLAFEFANESWEYDDQQIFTIKGFSLEQHQCIYHTNHLWNEIVFEQEMRLPSTDIVSEETYYPWYLKKNYFLYTKSRANEFIKEALNSPYFDDYILDIAKEENYPLLYRQGYEDDTRRLFIYINQNFTTPMRYGNLLLDVSKDIKNPIYGTRAGYAIFPNSLLAGFSHQTFLSNNLENLNETLDLESSLSFANNEEISVPKNVLIGHYSKGTKDGFGFEPIGDKKVIGNLPKNIDEIVISSALAKLLFPNDNYLESILHFAYTQKEKITEKGKIYRDFEINNLKIVGIIENSKNIIYQESDWSILYFLCRFNVSIFDLGITSISYELSDAKNYQDLRKKISRAFPGFEVTNPMSEINDSIEEICTYLTIALSTFSFASIIISVLLLSLSNYLHLLESKKDIGLARCIGIRSKEAKKFIYAQSFLTSSFAFLAACFELIVVSIFTQFDITKTLGISFNFSISPWAILAMLILVFVISIFSSFVISNKASKLSPLDALMN